LWLPACLPVGNWQVIRGSYSAEQQAPDADLGKSLREGFRNTAADDDRVRGRGLVDPER
jgi:hypothetical protein